MLKHGPQRRARATDVVAQRKRITASKDAVETWTAKGHLPGQTKSVAESTDMGCISQVPDFVSFVVLATASHFISLALVEGQPSALRAHSTAVPSTYSGHDARASGAVALDCCGALCISRGRTWPLRFHCSVDTARRRRLSALRPSLVCKSPPALAPAAALASAASNCRDTAITAAIHG